MCPRQVGGSSWVLWHESCFPSYLMRVRSGARGFTWGLSSWGFWESLPPETQTFCRFLLAKLHTPQRNLDFIVRGQVWLPWRIENFKELAGGPSVRISCSHCRGHKFNIWLGSSDLASHVVQPERVYRIIFKICVFLLFSCSVRSDSLRPHGL